jgi:alkylation response protein AidB-like acyl-CoA dehydrogenase
MDFAFSDEQRMLKEQARAVLSQRLSDERRAELADSGRPWDPELQRVLTELGWTGLSAPEDVGGAGMGFIEEAVVFEELGYACAPGPFFATVALAAPAAAGDTQIAAALVKGEPWTLAHCEPEGASSLLDRPRATKARRSGRGWRLSGTKDLVVGGDVAAGAVVSALTDDGPALFAVAAAAFTARRLAVLDLTRSLARLDLDDADARLLTGPDTYAQVMERVRLRALAAAALEAVGVGQRALDLARAYAGERQQFGRPIGAYQAVSHKVADTYMEVELARSLAYWAAWCVADDADQAALAIPAAKAFATEAALAACERSIQVHGGIGFTWEHPLHRYYKRARWLASFEATPEQHRAEVAERLLSGA